MHYKLRVKLNVAMAGRPKGAIVIVGGNAKGVPRRRNWRKRLALGAVDGSCEIITDDEPLSDKF
jgi:hypothetical protein